LANQKTIQRPELEAVLRVEGREICVVGFFKDMYGGYDVLVGLEDFDQRLLVSSTFNSCAEAVKEAVSIELAADEAEPPFGKDR